MEKQIYGNITNTARTQFQFDRIYPNKREMDECRDTDGVYTSRYILIEYNEDPTKNATELEIRNGKFYYKKAPTVQVIPNITIAPGKLCFVKDDKEYTFYESQGSEAQPFKKIYSCPFDDTNYNINWNIDYAKDHRGYDSTVWQKVYINNKQKYIMIAELNAKMPNLTMSLDAPGDNLAPHFDEHSNEDNFILHMPAMWDFQVRQAGDGEYSDEETRHLIKYDSDGNPLGQVQTTELIPAAIFYNKGAFQPYVYEPIEIVPDDEEEEYVGGKYYYKVNNVYGLREEENRNSILNFDNLEFYEEIKSSNPKKRYYNPEEKETYLNKEPTRLLKTNEEKWYSNQYFYISDYNFTISIEKFDPTVQYFKANINNDKVIYIPVESLTEEEYNNNPNAYYITQEKYSLDTSESFNENIVYFKETVKNGEKSYEPVILQDCNEYEKNRYYTFYDKDDEYFIIDYSPTRQPNRTYYYYDAQKEKYEVIEFLNKAYISGVYYYQDEEGKYLVDTNDKHTPGRKYYTRVKPVVISGEDKIIVTPTGSSKRLYNDHNGFLKAANDIQEISINLPSLGATIATVWDYVYGKDRNELIYSSPVYNPDMYGNIIYEEIDLEENNFKPNKYYIANKDNNGIIIGYKLAESFSQDQKYFIKKRPPLYQTGIGDLSNFVTIINQINDLIGHNMIKIDNYNNKISINEEDILIGNNKLDYLNLKNADKYIYWDEENNKFYRIKIYNTEAGYAYELIPMDSIGEGIDTIYGSLLEIQKALGTNEGTATSFNSLKEALVQLQQIIEDSAKSIEFVTIGQGLDYEKELAWRSVNGEPLDREWNEDSFISINAYHNYNDKNFIYWDKQYIKEKYLTPYKRVEVPTNNVDNNNFKNYYAKKEYSLIKIDNSENFDSVKKNLYLYDNTKFEYISVTDSDEYDSEKQYYIKELYVENDQPIYVKLSNYDKNESYYEFKKIATEEIDKKHPIINDQSEYTYFNVLPKFYIRGIDSDGKDIKIYKTKYFEDDDGLNIFNDEDIVEFYRYGIWHENPAASSNNVLNKTYNLLKEEKNGHSMLSELNVNAKGHIYGEGSKHILPQAIIVENDTALETLDVPIGTFAYVKN